MKERGKRAEKKLIEKYPECKQNKCIRTRREKQANTKLGKENKGEYDEAKRGVNILLALSGAAQTHPFCSILGHDAVSP